MARGGTIRSNDYHQPYGTSFALWTLAPLPVIRTIHSIANDAVRTQRPTLLNLNTCQSAGFQALSSHLDGSDPEPSFVEDFHASAR